MENKHWTEIREFLSANGCVPERVIDHLSVLGVIKMCAYGLGNMKIGYFQDHDVEEVERILFTYVGFKGWLLDLDFNPWYNYKAGQGEYELYAARIMSLTNLVDYDILNTSYRVCKKFDTILEEIKNYD